MLFSPVKGGKKWNTRVYILYVWKELKKTPHKGLLQKNPKIPTKTPLGTDSVKCSGFSKSTELLRFLLTSAGAEVAPHVPGLGLQGLLKAVASISINLSQCPQETSQSAHGVRADFGFLLVWCMTP